MDHIRPAQARNLHQRLASTSMQLVHTEEVEQAAELVGEPMDNSTVAAGKVTIRTIWLAVRTLTSWQLKTHGGGPATQLTIKCQRRVPR